MTTQLPQDPADSTGGENPRVGVNAGAMHQDSGVISVIQEDGPDHYQKSKISPCRKRSIV